MIYKFRSAAPGLSHVLNRNNHTWMAIKNHRQKLLLALLFGKTMHSSRMRTGRSLTVCRSLLPGGGGSVPRGCLLPGGVSALGGLLPAGVCSGGCLLRGVSGPRGCLLRGTVCSGGVCSGRGVSALGGCIPACTEADTPPCGQNHRRLLKHYLGPTSLRPVIIIPNTI